MKLPAPPARYDQDDQAAMRLLLEKLDTLTYKKTEALLRPELRNPKIDIGTGELVLTAPNGNKYAVGVDNSGNLTLTLV